MISTNNFRVRVGKGTVMCVFFTLKLESRMVEPSRLDFVTHVTLWKVFINIKF